MADINMTPLIDVMLVLLVIFLVTAPLMAASLQLQLPAGGSAGPRALPARAITVTLAADGTVAVDGEVLAALGWRARLDEAGRRDPATEVHLRADRRVAYGEVAAVIAAAQAAGLTRIGFVTMPDAPADAVAPTAR